MQIRRETLGAQVYDLLRNRILRGEIAGGARLVQTPLSEEMGISRIPIRDALKRLENDGLIVGDRVGRYTVVPFTAEDADEVYAIRGLLEPFAIAVAARKMTPEAATAIQSLYGQLSAAARERDLRRYTDLNVKFHMAIYEASGMRRLLRTIRGLWLGVPPLTPIVLEGRITRSHKEHDLIMRKLLARDGDGAAQALGKHIETAGAELRKALEPAESRRPQARKGERKANGQVPD